MTVSLIDKNYKDSLAYKIALVAWGPCVMTDIQLYEWGIEFIKACAQHGMYINTARNDPSGRW